MCKVPACSHSCACLSRSFLIDIGQVELAHRAQAVCIFVNDDCGAEVVKALHEQGPNRPVLLCSLPFSKMRVAAGRKACSAENAKKHHAPSPEVLSTLNHLITMGDMVGWAPFPPRLLEREGC